MRQDIPRIGKWTSTVALEEALKIVGEDDPVIVVAISRSDQMIRYWSANANNMEACWMADNVKADVMKESI